MCPFKYLRTRNLLILLLFGATAVFAQQKSLRFKHIGREQGLSLNYITSIYQDSHGFMWFGTGLNGANKYDGYEFISYRNRNDNKNSLIGNRVLDIVEDSRNYIWFATAAGLSRYDRKKDSFTNYIRNPNDPYSLSDNESNTLFRDSQGNLWVGTRSGLNLFDYENNRFIHYLDNETIKDIVEDSQHNLWIGTFGNGLVLFNSKSNTTERFLHSEKDGRTISSNHITALLKDSNGNLWIGTQDGGLNLLDRKLKTFKHFKRNVNDENSLSINAIYCLGEDAHGNIWIGTENGGLSIFNNKTNTFNNYKYNVGDIDGLNTNTINSLYKDRKGNMWVGTHAGGVNFFDLEGNRFNHYKFINSRKGLSHNMSGAITEDFNGNILIATDGGGLNILNKQTGIFTYYMHEEGNKNTICSNNLLSVLVDSYDNIWVGSWGSGVTMFNPAKRIYKHFKNNPADSTSLGANNAWTMFEDKDKQIWIGTYWGGLSLYHRDKDTFTQFRRNKDDDYRSIKSNSVNKIIQDKEGNLWIGTFAGLEVYDYKTKTFTNFLHNDSANSISNNAVTCILEGDADDLWVGTLKGLNHFNKKTKKFTHYTEEDGLPDDLIHGILADDKGNLWITSNEGLSQFNLKTKTFKNYIVSEDVQISQFNQSAYKSKAGFLYFGGINGLIEFKPEDIQDIAFEPRVVLTNFKIFNEPVKIGDSTSGRPFLKMHISETKELTLSYKESVLTFDFVVLNYINERKKQYAYFMEGFDTKWNHVGSKHTATYTNLEPGNYTFIVKALNNEGEWSRHQASLKITITPPYWETWWFRVVAVGSIMGGALALYQSRINRVKMQKRMLEEQVEARTQQLQLANAELIQQKEKVLSQATDIERLYLEIKDSIRAAEVIQASTLPSPELIQNYFRDFLAFYRPKDIVSGDFYWFGVKDDKILIAAADCTGHGVSGSLMAINGHYLLNVAVSSFEGDDLKAAAILEKLNEEINKELNQEKFDFPYGMEIALCILDKEKMQMQFAGANSPLYIIRSNKLIEVRGDTCALGGNVVFSNGKNFTNNYLDIQKDDMLYLFSDGYPDQFGGEGGETKFMYNKFRKLLTTISQEDITTQLTLLEKNLVEWKGNTEQTDDIMIIGFRI